MGVGEIPWFLFPWEFLISPLVSSWACHTICVCVLMVLCFLFHEILFFCMEKMVFPGFPALSYRPQLCLSA